MVSLLIVLALLMISITGCLMYILVLYEIDMETKWKDIFKGRNRDDD